MRYAHRAALGAIVVAFALLLFAEGAALPTVWLPREEAATLQHARGGGSAQSAGSVIYPAVLAPAARSLSLSAGYRFAQALNALLCALMAIPAYLLARRLVSPGWSLAVAALAVAAPASVYATAAVPDSLALLLALWSLPLLVRASERGSRRDLVAALALAAAAALARPWFVVLPPALLVAYELPRRGESSFLRWPRSLVFAGFAAFAYFLLARTAPEVGSALTAPGATSRAAAAGLAVVALGAGIVPCLVVAAGARPSKARPETTLLLACLVALALAAGVFGAAEGGVDERPLLVLVPLLLALAASAWSGGVVRLRGAAFAGVLIVLAALALPALGRVPSAHAAGLSLVALNGASRTALAAGVAVTVALALLLLLVFRRHSFAVPAVVALVLVGGQAAAWSSVRAEARADAAAEGVPHGWIDRHAGPGAHVFAVGPPGAFDARIVAGLTLWNRSFRGVRVLDVSHVDPTSGTLSVSGTPLVLVRGADLAGTEIARSAAGVLLRASSPLRLGETVEGLYPDGWSGPTAVYRRFGGPPRPGKVLVQASRATWKGPDRPGELGYQVGPLGGGAVILTGPGLNPQLHSGQTVTREVDVPPPPFQVVVTVNPTFSPAQFGASDQRQIGAVLRFTYEPGK